MSKTLKWLVSVITMASLLSVISLAAADVSLNSTAFPDSIFRKYISDQFDTNPKDGILSNQEIKAVTAIELNGLSTEEYRNIHSLKGIEYFTNLTSLDCYRLSLSSLDLSKNLKLTQLSSEHCGLSALDVTHNTLLKELYCLDQKITSLNVSQNPELEILCCQVCSLSTLDISHNLNLRVLCCYANSIKQLDVSSSTILSKLVKEKERIPYQESIVDDWGQFNSAEGYLRVENSMTVVAGNYISKPYPLIADLFPDPTFREYILNNVDSDKNARLSDREVKATTSIKLSALSESSYSKVKSLQGIEHFPDLTSLICNGLSLSSLDVSKNQKLKSLSVEYCGISTLDVSKNTGLTSLSYQDPKVTSLDLQKNLLLESLCCQDCSISRLDLSKNTKLKELVCYSTKLTKVDVSSCAALSKLVQEKERIPYPKLTADDWGQFNSTEGFLRVGNNMTVVAGTYISKPYPFIADLFPDPTFREYILNNVDSDQDTRLSGREVKAATSISLSTITDSSFSKIKSLQGIEHLTDLTYLVCHGLSLSSLDVSKNRKLKSLTVEHSGISSLDVSKNTELTHLGCLESKVTSLNLQNNLLLERLYCQCCSLSKLDLSKNTKLKALVCFLNKLTKVDVSSSAVLSALVQNTPRIPYAANIYYDDWGSTDEAAGFLRTDLHVSVIAGNYTCKPFSRLYLPAGLKKIESEAFSGVPCDVVYIPQGCTSIASKAFANCKHLQHVFIPSSVKNMANDAFTGCSESLTIHNISQ